MLKKSYWGVLLALLFSISSLAQEYRLEYTEPAADWTEALPIGNGTLGAMIYGGVKREHIQFNEISLVNGNETRMGYYQPFGDIFIDFEHNEHYAEYHRKLSLQDAVCTVDYEIQGVNYNREYFCSYPDQIIAIRVAADKPGMLNCHISAVSTHHHPVTYLNNGFTFSGSFDTGLQYLMKSVVIVQGGAHTTTHSRIKIEGADSFTLFITAGTSYVMDYTRRFLGEHPGEKIEKRLSDALRKGYTKISKDHLFDYQRLYNRTSLVLNDQLHGEGSVSDRLSAYREGGKDNSLDALLFQYGRYLLISSSRPGGLPANLQGLWNRDTIPAWCSQYTTNINLQMNYWPAELTGLSECHAPLFDWLENIAHVQKKSSDPKLQAEVGWKAYSTMNIMGGNTGWMIHHPGPAWLIQHFWLHYAFTGDRSFLRKRAYPLLKEQVQYWERELITSQDGKLIVREGWSPEHGPNKKEGDRTHYPGVSYDQQIIYDLFSNFIEAAEVLQTDMEYKQKIAQMRDHLLQPQVGRWGQLQEWMEDWDREDDVHRHVSHLFAVHPGRQITPVSTPGWAKAALVSLRARGLKSTGWSTSWKINLYARLGQGNEAYAAIRQLITNSVQPNLFDLHPPFQIDGNFGFTAGVVEMLLQSHDQAIAVLPALPDEWKEGSVKGLHTRGGFIVDFDWKERKLTYIKVKSTLGGLCRIRTNGEFFQPVKGHRITAVCGYQENENPFFPSVISPYGKRKPTTEIEFMTRPGQSYCFKVRTD